MVGKAGLSRLGAGYRRETKVGSRREAEIQGCFRETSGDRQDRETGGETRCEGVTRGTF